MNCNEIRFEAMKVMQRLRDEAERVEESQHDLACAHRHLADVLENALDDHAQAVALIANK